MSLEVIDSCTSKGNSRQLFTKLSILRKRQRVSFDVVERIWGLTAVQKKTHLEMFGRLNIRELSFGRFGVQNKRCTVLHDLFVDLARTLAEMDPICTENAAK